MTNKNEMSEFTDRELIELLLTSQVDIIREIKRLKDQVEGNAAEGRGQYWITFMKMLDKSSEMKEQFEDYLKNKADAHKNYNPEEDGEG